MIMNKTVPSQKRFFNYFVIVKNFMWNRKVNLAIWYRFQYVRLLTERFKLKAKDSKEFSNFKFVEKQILHQVLQCEINFTEQ